MSVSSSPGLPADLPSHMANILLLPEASLPPPAATVLPSSFSQSRKHLEKLHSQTFKSLLDLIRIWWDQAYAWHIPHVPPNTSICNLEAGEHRFHPIVPGPASRAHKSKIQSLQSTGQISLAQNLHLDSHSSSSMLNSLSQHHSSKTSNQRKKSNLFWKKFVIAPRWISLGFIRKSLSFPYFHSYPQILFSLFFCLFFRLGL